MVERSRDAGIAIDGANGLIALVEVSFLMDIIAFIVGLSQMSIPFLRAHGLLLLIQEPLFRLTPAGIKCGEQDREAFVPVRYGPVVEAEIGRSHLITLRIKRSVDGGVAPSD